MSNEEQPTATSSFTSPSAPASTPPPSAGGNVRQPPPRHFLLMLVAVAAVSPLGINLYLPSLPSMSRVLGVDFAAVQFTLSVYLAAVAAGQLVIGPISDRYGRRPVLLGGLALFVLGSVICMLAPDIGVLAAGRVVQAMGGCAGIALSRAIVRDLYDRSQAASMIGYVTMGMAVAPMVAPTIGGLLEAAYGWRAAFAFLALFGAATLAVTYLRLHETNPWKDKAPGLAELGRAYRVLVRSRAFWGYALTAAFTAAAFYSFVAGGSYVIINQMGRTPVEYGMYFAMVSLGYIMGNFCSGRYAMRVGSLRLIGLGGLLAVLAALAMAVLYGAGVVHPLTMFAPMFLLAVGNGLVLPSCIAGAVSVKPEVAGAASGLAGSIQIGFGAVVAPLIGALLQDTAWPLIAVVGVCAAACMLTLRTLVR